MRKSKLYYKALMNKAKVFLKNYDENSKQEFVLRQIIKSKEFKKELQRENERGMISLFSFDELLQEFVY